MRELAIVLATDGDEQVREHAAKALAEADDVRAARALAGALRSDEAVLVRIAAADALATVAVVNADVDRALIESALDSSEYETVSGLAAAALAHHQDVTLPEGVLTQLPSSPDMKHVRLELAMGLASRGRGSAIEPLLDALATSKRHVRRLAVMVLAPFRNEPRVREALERALSDDAIEVREAAASSLGDRP